MVYVPTGNRQKRCPKCIKVYNKQWQQNYRCLETSIVASRLCQKKYCHTLKGYLARLYNNINQRCHNTKQKSYENYGGRGIQNKFESVNEFINYIVDHLGYNRLEKIKGLQIDRINNNGNYEPGNIQFVTQTENLRNRGGT